MALGRRPCRRRCANRQPWSRPAQRSASDQERMVPMETPLEYKVIQLIPDDRPWLDPVQQLLRAQTDEGWELVTAFQYQGAAPQRADPIVQSLSHVASTVFIFKQRL